MEIGISQFEKDLIFQLCVETKDAVDLSHSSKITKTLFLRVLQQSSEIDNLIDRLKKQDTPKSICKNTNTW